MYHSKSLCGRRRGKKKTSFYVHHLLFYNNVFFQSRLNVKAPVYFFRQFYVQLNVNLFIHAFMHPCFLCDEEKQVCQ